jgi:AraC-like DNA-binding protein
MAVRTSALKEIVDYRRSVALPGVQVIDAQHSPREWRVACPDFAVVMFRTWRGGVHSRGRLHPGEPGLVFCNTPGEVMVANPYAEAGSFSVIELEFSLIEQWLSEQQPSALRFDWTSVMQPISMRLRARFCEFFDVFEASASAMQVQSLMLELSEVMIGELVQGARAPRPPAGPRLGAAARMRECLNEEGLNVDLETLAKRAGLSRFQALRAFKHRYGLPPHAYQLALRIGHARKLLRAGAAAADVAARCGFADQSHFTRHFKRINGVTPAQYARAETPSAGSRSGTFRVARDPDELRERSDR